MIQQDEPGKGVESLATIMFLVAVGGYLVLFFAEGKFYTIFAFLFGLGFSVQLARAEARGKAPGRSRISCSVSMISSTRWALPAAAWMVEKVYIIDSRGA